MGTVYEAIDLRLRNVVAVKQMTAGSFEADQACAEFALGNNAGARAWLEEAVRLLPPTDPCFVQAKRILEKLRNQAVTSISVGTSPSDRPQRERHPAGLQTRPT